MFKTFLAYNFAGYKALGQLDGSAWSSTAFFMSIPLSSNVGAILFLFFATFYPEVDLGSPVYVLGGVSYLLCFLLLSFNKSWKKYAIKNQGKRFSKNVKWIWWSYYIGSVLFFSYAISVHKAI